MAARRRSDSCSSPRGRCWCRTCSCSGSGRWCCWRRFRPRRGTCWADMPGQVSVGHAVYFGAGAYASLVVYTELGWPPIAGAPVGVVVSMAHLGADRHADIPVARALFLHGDDRGGGVVPHPCRQLAAAGGRGGVDGTAGAADGLGPVVHQSDPVPLSVPGGADRAAGSDLADAAQPDGVLPGGDPRRRPGGAQPRRAGAAVQAVCAAAVGRRSPRSPGRCTRSWSGSSIRTARWGF